MKTTRGNATPPEAAGDPALVLISVPRDRVDFMHWLAEAPAGVLLSLLAALETGLLDAPLTGADDEELAQYHGQTAEQLFTAAMRDPAESAWARENWRDWLARMPRSKREAD